MTVLKQYALRLDFEKESKRDKQLEVVHKIIEYLQPKKYLFTFEISKETKKPHSHAIIETETDYKLDTVSKWMRRQPFYLGKGSYSFVLVKDTAKYKDYIMKDMNILITNYTEDQIDYLIEKAQEIKTDKELKLTDKLFNYITDGFIDEEPTELTNHQILVKILQYYKEKSEAGQYILMPNRNQMFQYVATIQIKLGNESQTEFLYSNLF